MTDPKVVAELKRIADAHGGELRPADIVKAARPVSSPLHDKFEWNDDEAAERYRLWQARQLIRITVEYIGPEGDEIMARVFVSLTPDRIEGGYRRISVVMNDPDQRKQLLADALDELDRCQKKYAGLKELDRVFAELRKVNRKKPT